MIDIEELQLRLAEFAQEREWEQFHTPKNLALALVGEVGELCELLQWKSEGEVANALGDLQFRNALADELADVLIYLTRLSSVTGIDLADAVERKIQSNGERYPVEDVRGSSEKRP